jgi:Protein of unknown function (DUF1616)
MRGHRDLWLVVAGAVFCAAAALLVPLEVIRLVAAAPLCLLFPGYALASATFSSRSLSGGRFAALVLGLSLIILILSALLLNYGPGGIRDVSWAVILVLITIAACCWAAVKRNPGEAPYVAWSRPRVSPGDYLSLGGAAVAVVAALAVSATVYPAGDVQGFTRLAMLADPGGNTATIGIKSNEQDRQSYVLRLTLAGGRLVTKRLSLDPGDESVLRVRLPRDRGQPSGELVASLYRASSPDTLYRRVNSWLPPP